MFPVHFQFVKGNQLHTGEHLANQEELFMTETKILELLRDGFLKGEELDVDTSLFRSGLLDSMSMLTLLSLVEELFGVSILDDSFDVREVDAVRQMAAVVTRREASRTGGGVGVEEGRTSS